MEQQQYQRQTHEAEEASLESRFDTCRGLYQYLQFPGHLRVVCFPQTRAAGQPQHQRVEETPVFLNSCRALLVIGLQLAQGIDDVRLDRDDTAQ